MNINFLGPVLPTDSFTQMAFVEILNIILTSDNIVDVNRMLIGRNVNPTFGSLSGHFRWSYANDHFTLWQRMEYNSPICFGPHIQHPFRYAGKPRQEKEQYDNELKTYIST